MWEIALNTSARDLRTVPSQFLHGSRYLNLLDPSSRYKVLTLVFSKKNVHFFSDWNRTPGHRLRFSS